MDKLATTLNRTRLHISVALAIALPIWLAPDAVYAHAFPAGSQPGVGSTLSAPPSEVEITFDSPIESMFARLDVSNSGGSNENAGAPTVSDDHRQLSVKVKPLPPGAYEVRWTVVAEDGHRTEGSYNFTVSGQ